MKKILAFVAIVAMVFGAASCKKDDKGGKGKKEKKEYVAPINIDGDFSDWAKLDASKVSTATCDPEATKTALKSVKVYADEVFIYVYFEWDKDQITFEAGKEHVPFHCYVNGDGNTATGGFSSQWTDACSDALFEGFIYPEGVIGSYDPGVYKWWGDPNGDGWDWSEVEGEDSPILAAGSGICKGAGIEGKYEFYITRELYPLGKIADTFSIGFDIQQNWDTVGFLPNGHVDETVEGSTGLVPSLKVVTVKE